MKFSPRLLLLLLAALTLPLSQMVFPGCAVSSDTSPQALARWQNLPKVHVFLDGLPIGVTPVFARLSRDDVHRLRIEMAGYEPFEFPLRVPSEKTPAESPWGSSGILVNVMVNATTGVVQRFDQPGKARYASNGLADTLRPRDVIQIRTTGGDYSGAQNVGRLRRR